jgi:hypothetical protein
MTTLVGVRRALTGQGVPSPAFFLPLNDLGSGAVNTSASLAFPGTTATFTRATVAYTKLASGLWAQVASGTARSTYLGLDTTAVGAYGGYYAEMAATQLVTPTASIRDMTNAAWVKTTMTTAQTSTGIDGAANSCTRCTASAGNATVIQTLAAAATSRTYSCWIKRITGTGNIELTQDGSTFTNIASSINGSTFTRVALNASQLNATFGIRIATSGDAIDVDFNQFEAGAFATSPMATAGAARNVDLLTYTTTGNIVSAVGTAYAEVTALPSIGTAAGVVLGADGAAGNGQVITKASGQAATTISSYDGTTTNTKTGISDYSATSTPIKVATAWSGALQRVTQVGLAPATAAFDGTMGDLTLLSIGSNATGLLPWNGTIRNVRVWTVALTDAQIGGLS